MRGRHNDSVIRRRGSAVAGFLLTLGVLSGCGGGGGDGNEPDGDHDPEALPEGVEEMPTRGRGFGPEERDPPQTGRLLCFGNERRPGPGYYTLGFKRSEGVLSQGDLISN